MIIEIGMAANIPIKNAITPAITIKNERRPKVNRFIACPSVIAQDVERAYTIAFFLF